MKPTLAATLTRIEQRYQTKVADQQVDGDALSQIAAGLRAYRPSEPSYAVLREALRDHFHVKAAAVEPRGATPWHALAAALREHAHREKQAQYDILANQLLAARALTLLRDRIAR